MLIINIGQNRHWSQSLGFIGLEVSPLLLLTKNCRLFAKFKIPYLDLDFKTTLGVLEGENTFPLQDSWTTPKHSAHTWLLIFARTELFFCINPHYMAKNV